MNAWGGDRVSGVSTDVTGYRVVTADGETLSISTEKALEAAKNAVRRYGGHIEVRITTQIHEWHHYEEPYANGKEKKYGKSN